MAESTHVREYRREEAEAKSMKEDGSYLGVYGYRGQVSLRLVLKATLC